MAQSQKSEQAAKKGGSSATPVEVPKILRIGIVSTGKIVEERLVRKRGDVTIGQSMQNTFVVPASYKSLKLFELVNGNYCLNFTDGMDGRIASDQAVAPQALLQLKPKATKKGPLYQLPLSDKSRGKIVIGDLTVLFQFVVPPPVQARPQLPPSVRGSITQNLDWLMLGIVTASIFSHLGFVVYLRQLDWPRKPDIEEIPDRFVQLLVPKAPEKKEAPKVDPNAGKEVKKEEKKSKDTGEKKDKAPAKPVDEAQARAAAAARVARLNKEVASMGVLKILGAKGGEGGGIADLVKGGGIEGDADRVFQQVGGVGVASSGGGLRSAKGAGGTGTAKGIGGLRASGPAEVSSGEKGSERVASVKGSVKDSAPMEMDGALDPNVVANEIRRRKGAIIACYERALKRNPSLGGKVELQFTVSSVGKVTGAEIGTDTMHDEEVNSCIVNIVKSWRFPAPDGGEVHFAYPFIFQASK